MQQKILVLLFISGEPLTIDSISKLSGISVEDINKFIPELKQYLKEGGFDLLVNQNELSIITQPQHAQLVTSLWIQELHGDLTPAALQVLTIAAYLTNPTRQDISFIRGVQSSQSIRTLVVKGYLTVEKEVCSLTSEALKHLGITNVTELPEYESLHRELTEKLEVAKNS